MWDSIDISGYLDLAKALDWANGIVEMDNLTEYAYKQGYDGVIIKNVREGGGEFLGGMMPR